MKVMPALGATLSLLTFNVALASFDAEAVELASHRAIYDLSLAKAQPSSGLVGVDGRLVLEWRESCDGSVSNQRLGFRAQLEDGPSFVYDVSFSSWESADATELRFNMTSYDNGELVEKYQGEASLDDLGDRGVASYNEPSGSHQELPAGTVFPTQHLKALIESARAGEHFTSHDVFDGSGLDALASVTAIIGEPVGEVGGISMTHWPVSLAYFAIEGDSDLPQFEISFMLATDGVLRDVVLNYGDFVLNGDVIEIENLPSPSCS